MIQIPMMTSSPGLASEVHGLVDLIEEKALYFEDPFGSVIREDEIPQEYRALAEDKRQVWRVVSLLGGSKRLENCIAKVLA